MQLLPGTDRRRVAMRAYGLGLRALRFLLFFGALVSWWPEKAINSPDRLKVYLCTLVQCNLSDGKTPDLLHSQPRIRTQENGPVRGPGQA